MAFECPLNGQLVRKTAVFQLFFGVFFAKYQGNISFFIENGLRINPRQENMLNIMIEPVNRCGLTKKCSLHTQLCQNAMYGHFLDLCV